MISSLAATWASRLGDGRHLDIAVDATQRCFGAWGLKTLGPRERVRVDAYFGAVVRRAVMRAFDEQGRPARQRLVAASIEADLLQAGWRADRAATEARRITGTPAAGAA